MFPQTVETFQTNNTKFGYDIKPMLIMLDLIFPNVITFTHAPIPGTMKGRRVKVRIDSNKGIDSLKVKEILRILKKEV